MCVCVCGNLRLMFLCRVMPEERGVFKVCAHARHTLKTLILGTPFSCKCLNLEHLAPRALLGIKSYLLLLLFSFFL